MWGLPTYTDVPENHACDCPIREMMEVQRRDAVTPKDPANAQRAEAPHIGQRVILAHLLHEGCFPGEIAGIDPISGLCLVKLDCQDRPVRSVLYYAQAPAVVESSLFQICYPDQEMANAQVCS